MAKELAIIVDVDGTLADMRGVRGPFEWLKVSQDKPHKDVIDLVKDLESLGEFYHQDDDENGYREKSVFIKKYKIIIVTGRDGICEESTKVWLEHYKIPYDEFFIRPEGDFRKDNVIKSEIYMDHIRPKYDVKFVIDDRDQVVDMWRSLGLRVLQVAPGNF
tara:strand:- start:8518 stop:9000 length:483 start_codon:yes stop_codon:yes gene_type:complete